MTYLKRNCITAVLFSFISCGFYMYYWIYVTSDYLYRLNNEENKAGLDILFSIITCGIYFIYLNYKWGKMLNQARIQYGAPSNDESVLFVLLSIFGLSIINLCIIQSALNNEIIDVANNNQNNFYN